MKHAKKKGIDFQALEVETPPTFWPTRYISPNQGMGMYFKAQNKSELPNI